MPEGAYWNSLDRIDTRARPSLTTRSHVEALERRPWPERLAATSTFGAIAHVAALRPDTPAIIVLPQARPEDADEPNNITTYGDLLKGCIRAANLFHRLGVGPSDVVSLMMPLVPHTFFALYGAQAVGIANPVNPFLEPHQIAEILIAANTKVLVAMGPSPGSDLWEKVQKLRPLLPADLRIVQVGLLSDASVEADIIDFAQGCAMHSSDHLEFERVIQPDDVAGYFHTGGTTGTPKLVRHTHSNQLYQAWVCTLMLPSSADARLLFGLPVFHVGGALTQGLSVLATGRCMVIVSPAGWRNPEAVRRVWSLVDRFRPEVFGGVPTVLAAAQAMPSDGCDTSSVRFISGGGSAIPVAVAQAMQERFQAPVLEVYGMTETSSVHTISYADRPVRLGSVGHPVPYSRVRIVKLDGQGHVERDCAVDEIGVVAMAGPGVFGGYLSEVHNQGAFVEPGWVNSGDLGRLDADGYLWITGRAKDLIIRGGHNIDPLALEECFYQHPAVGLAALVGQPDAYAGELPVAYVQLKPGAAVTEAQLMEHVRARTPERAAVPVRMVILPALPLTAVGKVFKPALRWDAAQRVFAEALAPLAAQALKTEVQVGADGTHGTLARVRVTAWPETMAREAIVQAVSSRLDPFTIRHTVEFS